MFQNRACEFRSAVAGVFLLLPSWLRGGLGVSLLSGTEDDCHIVLRLIGDQEAARRLQLCLKSLFSLAEAV